MLLVKKLWRNYKNKNYLYPYSNKLANECFFLNNIALNIKWAIF